jgi:hypothetical protein
LFKDENIFTGKARSDSPKVNPRFSLSDDGVHWTRESSRHVRDGIVRNRVPLFAYRYGDVDIVATTTKAIPAKVKFSDWFKESKNSIPVEKEFDSRYHWNRVNRRRKSSPDSSQYKKHKY